MNVRTHVVLPASLLEQVDRIARGRKRSSFIAAAVREKLARERLRIRLHSSAGVIDSAQYPEWQTPERTSRWVRRRREADDLRRNRKRGARRTR